MRKEKQSRGGAKRAEIVAAARAVFLREGYADASMDAVTAESGVSKQTLYRYFPGKELLFRSVLEELLASVPALTADTAGQPPRTRVELERLLLRLAGSIVGSQMQPAYVSVLRVVFAETRRVPSLGALYRETVIAAGLARVGAILDQARRDCLIACDDLEAAARLFLGGLVIHLVQDGLLLPDGAVRPPGPDRLAAHVRLVLRALG